MKQTIKLPLYSIYSLINDIEEMANNPETAEQYKNLQSALNSLKEAFMPLINEYKDCCNMPDIHATVGSGNDIEDEDGDQPYWDDKRFELIKAAMQGRLAATDRKLGFQKSFVASIARDAILMADTLIEEMKKSNGHI